MRALVTGGTGFIGSEVVRQLIGAGNAVRIFSRRKDIPALFDGNVEMALGDLAHAESLIDALDGIEIFYHIGEIKNTSKAASERNVRLLKEVLGEIKNIGVRRIVFVSSITVRGIPSSLPANEDTPPRVVLNDHYTDYKRRSEELLIKNAAKAEYVIIRPAFVYGPGSRYLGKLISILNSLGPIGIPFPGNAENLTPLIYVKDLASAIFKAGLEPAAAGKIFNLTDGFRHSWREVLEAIAERLGKKFRIIPIPRLLLHLSALPLDLVSAFLGIRLDSAGYINYFLENIYFDNVSTRNLLKWHPHYSLKDGIKEMTEFYAKGNH